MNIKETKLKGNYLIDLDTKEDDRGFFARLFCEKKFLINGLNTKWLQINNSMSTEIGTLRGLHFQKPPSSEIKLVRCIKGMIWDVVVDLRNKSKTYGCWFGTNLSSENRTMMYVPKGFAHGFVTLEKNSEILYLVSEFYNPELEETLLWNDDDIDIKWPINPIKISKKDKNGLNFKKIKSMKI